MSLNLFSKIIVAASGSALAGIGTAAAEGHVAPWWVIILIGVIAAAAGVIMQSPVDHEAIAERKANATPPAALLLLVFLFGGLANGCAHVANVATACQGTITANLRNNVASALDREDYVSALEVAGSAVLPCVLVAAVKEVRDASAAASGTGAGEPKMAMRLDLVVRVRRADTWLAAHPDAGGSPPPK